MHLETQVTSFALSKLLKNVGVHQDALYYWDNKGNLLPKEETYINPDRFHEWYSAAFTVSELGALLPEWCSSHRDLDGKWEAYPSAIFTDVPAVHDQSNEAEARGKLLAALYERYPNFPSLDYAGMAG